MFTIEMIMLWSNCFQGPGCLLQDLAKKKFYFWIYACDYLILLALQKRQLEVNKIYKTCFHLTVRIEHL